VLRWDAVDLAAGTLKVAATMNVVDGRLEIGEVKSGRPGAPSRCRRAWWRC
jgi:hypothetical protein